jgi:hypothetical protein
LADESIDLILSNLGINNFEKPDEIPRTSGFLPARRSVCPAEKVDAALATVERKLNVYAALHERLRLTIPIACFDAQKPN